MPSGKSDLVRSVVTQTSLGPTATSGTSRASRALGSEILAEMAAALGRSAEHVTDALAVLARIDREIAEAVARGDEASAVAALVDSFNREREVAERRLWELTVHREALGLFDHGQLQRYYPIPPPKRAPSERLRAERKRQAKPK